MESMTAGFLYFGTFSSKKRAGGSFFPMYWLKSNGLYDIIHQIKKNFCPA